MADQARIRAEAERLFALFQKAGAVPVETAVLQPSEVLLDLYGEDIRARAYVTMDQLRGEHMLRPDFTVPIVQQHMTDGAEPARYTYQGPVFRQQEPGSGRANEYWQVGYELFDRETPAIADAEVFALFSEILGPRYQASIGDIGLLVAAVNGLSTSERRRAALLRHIWRPARFRDLLERFAGLAPMPEGREELVQSLKGLNVKELVELAGPAIGHRSVGEVVDRLDTLTQDIDVAPIPEAEVAAVTAILGIDQPADDAAEALAKIATGFPAITTAAQGFVARLNAMVEMGVDVSRLRYEGSYGRTSMEYYDGFVFGFAAKGRAPVATGGRYDALTRVLGQGREIPAVGGVIRPERLLELAR